MGIGLCGLEDSETTGRIIFAATLVKPGDGQMVVRSILHFPAPKNLRMDTVRGQGTGNAFEFQCHVPVKGIGSVGRRRSAVPVSKIGAWTWCQARPSGSE